MKPLIRGAAPTWLSDAPGDQQTRRDWYTDLRELSGDIRDRWNNKDASKQQPIRDALYTMSGGECAWCGCALYPKWHVDHYLPKKEFPRLSYCWQNLLPCCIFCNEERKGRFAPRSLPPDSLIDPALTPTHGAAPPEQRYVPAAALPPIADRLIDPALDLSTSPHPLPFHPAIHGYAPQPGIGKTTWDRFFNRKEDSERWEKISVHVRSIIRTSTSRSDLNKSLASLTDLIGCSFYVAAYAEHWLPLLRPAWFVP